MYIHVPDKTEHLLKQTTNNPFLHLGFVDGLLIQVKKFLDTHLLVKQAKNRAR